MVMDLYHLQILEFPSRVYLRRFKDYFTHIWLIHVFLSYMLMSCWLRSHVFFLWGISICRLVVVNTWLVHQLNHHLSLIQSHFVRWIHSVISCFNLREGAFSKMGVTPQSSSSRHGWRHAWPWLSIQRTSKCLRGFTSALKFHWINMKSH